MKKTWFKKNETLICGCSNPKSAESIYCFDCGMFWMSQLDKDNLPFKNSNDSVDWMNTMFGECFRLRKEALEKLSC